MQGGPKRFACSVYILTLKGRSICNDVYVANPYLLLQKLFKKMLSGILYL